MNRADFMRWFGLKKGLSSDKSSQRQRQFLSFFLILILIILGVLSLIDISDQIGNNSPTLTAYVEQDLLMILGVGFLIWLNRRGFTLLAAYGFIVICLIGVSLTESSEFLLYSMFFFSLPILAASFIIHPRAAVIVAALGIVIYLGNPASYAKIAALSTPIFLVITGVLAVASWFFSARLERALRELAQSEQKYIALLEKNPFCVYMAEGSQAGRWEYLSSRFQDLLGITPNDWVGQAGQWVQRVHPDDRQRVLTEISQTLVFGLPFQSEYRMLHESGKVVWVSDVAHPARLPDQPERVQGVIVDITARKHAEQIQAATYRISQAAFSADDLVDLYRKIHAILGELMHVENFYIALYDLETDRLHFPYFVDQYDEPPVPVIARHGLTEYVLRTAEAIFATREKCAELVAMGEISDIGAPSVDWMGVPLMLNNRAIGVMVVQSYTEGIRFSDAEMEILQFVSTQVAMVIERKRAEAELKELSQLNAEVISGVNTGIIVYDREGRHLVWNHYMVEMTGLPQESVLGQSVYDVFPLFQRENLMKMMQQAMSGEIVPIADMEYTIPPSGKSGWLAGYAGPHRDAQGEVIGTIAVINDISERKKANDALHSALLEKEVLLREIHHRVKNNLQVMSSLMSLQADTVDNEQVRQSFLEMQTRVQTMALIHEELYQAKNLSRVNLADYIGRLAASLGQGYLLNPNVSLEVDVEDAFLGVDTAIPCGLIVNELVSNAFKYAFPDNRSGEVQIRLHSNAEGNFNLTVRDNGIGLPVSLDIYRTETLGMQLVTILAAQMGSQLELEIDGGTSFHIQFCEKWKN